MDGHSDRVSNDTSDDNADDSSQDDSEHSESSSKGDTSYSLGDANCSSSSSCSSSTPKTLNPKTDKTHLPQQSNSTSTDKLLSSSNLPSGRKMSTWNVDTDSDEILHDNTFGEPLEFEGSDMADDMDFLPSSLRGILEEEEEQDNEQHNHVDAQDIVSQLPEENVAERLPLKRRVYPKYARGRHRAQHMGVIDEVSRLSLL